MLKSSLFDILYLYIWAQYYSLFLHIITAIVRRFVGTGVRNVGDGILNYFQSPEIRGLNNEHATWLECSLAATEFHRDIKSIRNSSLEGLAKIDYRIRLDYGEIMLAKSKVMLNTYSHMGSRLIALKP